MKIHGARHDGALLVSMLRGQLNIIDPARCVISACFDEGAEKKFGPWVETSGDIAQRREAEHMAETFRVAPLESFTLRDDTRK